MQSTTQFTITDDSIVGIYVTPHRQQAPARHSIWGTSIRFAIITSVLLGLAYPLFVTGVAQLLFPHQANGSLLFRNGQVTGSELIGQSFSSDKYFHPRPSAAGSGYDATASGGSNLSQSNAKLVRRIQKDIDELQSGSGRNPVPIDMVTTSGSGLDPDITPGNAYFQAGRIAAARGMSEDAVRKLIAGQTRSRDLKVLGEPRVNVLKLNLALDQTPASGTH